MATSAMELQLGAIQVFNDRGNKLKENASTIQILNAQTAVHTYLTKNGTKDYLLGKKTIKLKIHSTGNSVFWQLSSAYALCVY